jgi:hypothetical protein
MVYQYVVRGAQKSLAELRTIQDWYVPLMFFIIFGGPLPQFATAIWAASLYNRALSLYSCEAPHGSRHSQGLARRAAQRLATSCAIGILCRFW